MTFTSDFNKTSYKVPDGVEVIRDFATHGIKKITIPESVKYIGRFNFYNELIITFIKEKKQFSVKLFYSRNNTAEEKTLAELLKTRLLRIFQQLKPTIKYSFQSDIIPKTKI